MRFERELSQSNRREILMQAAKHLPMQCRTITGGVLLVADIFKDICCCDYLLHRFTSIMSQCSNEGVKRSSLFTTHRCYPQPYKNGHTAANLPAFGRIFPIFYAFPQSRSGIVKFRFFPSDGLRIYITCIRQRCIIDDVLEDRESNCL